MSEDEPTEASDELDPEAVAFYKQGAKALMRKRYRSIRRAVPASGIAARSARIVDRLAEHPLVLAARSVALFEPILSRNEVDLRRLDTMLRERGVELFYPSIDGETRMMVFRKVDDRARLEERGHGFGDPGPEAAEATSLDVIVVPALAVDDRGHRLGYGAGFYDRALPRYAPPARTIAVVFGFQLAVEVPDTEGDFAVDEIATDDRLIETSRPRV